MKCPKCGGNAELSNWGSFTDPDYADFHVECEKCGYHSMGSTDPQKAKEMFEKEMGMYYTNEQWLKSLDTEGLVDYLYEVHKGGNSVERQRWIENHKERVKMQFRGWLKEKHNGV